MGLLSTLLPLSGSEVAVIGSIWQPDGISFTTLTLRPESETSCPS